ncbi:MAG TPA: glycoside hydrolase family 15 protein [Gemmatimonadaceae bacterium]|nr:glycoside hydrolase family 15 protein [Gemmatimonadaceae bacterium]
MGKARRRGRSRDLASRYPPIEHHGVIGDLQTVALVGLDGRISFLCLPESDSATVFASVLDADRGGCFEIIPALDQPRYRQMYLPDTNVLLTRVLSDSGVCEISDFMPVPTTPGPSRIIRRVKAVRGSFDVDVRCAPRAGYGALGHSVRVRGTEAIITADDGSLRLRLAAQAPLRRNGDDVVARVHLEPNESVAMVLEQLADGHAPFVLDRAHVARAFKQTVNFWRHWIGKSNYSGRWYEEISRSALALKLLQSRRTGGILAAPTFGLPTSIGGKRNWDYRYIWVRDSAFAVYALLRLGLFDEAEEFTHWVEKRSAAMPHPGQLQPVYALDGRSELREMSLTHLDGYRRSRPVRIGNKASEQLQLDIYGELIDTLYLFDRFKAQPSYTLWGRICEIVDWVCQNWERPDEGIWEVRGGPQHFLYSRVMCWVAIDRALRIADRRSIPAPIERWREVRDAIYRDVFTNFWDESQRTFVGIKGTDVIDAACLIMPLVHFISPNDPRWVSTLRAVEERLMDDSLVYRYDTRTATFDPLGGNEGTFAICSFWYVECLSRGGDLQAARLAFEKLLGYANHLGLYSEQIGPRGEHLGNFPQALTHIALISAAYDLNRRLTREGWSA